MSMDIDNTLFLHVRDEIGTFGHLAIACPESQWTYMTDRVQEYWYAFDKENFRNRIQEFAEELRVIRNIDARVIHPRPID